MKVGKIRIFIFQINVLSKTKMIEFLNKSKYLKKYIYISTPEILVPQINIDEKSNLYSPQTPYATSKLSFEYLLKNYQKILIFL